MQISTETYYTKHAHTAMNATQSKNNETYDLPNKVKETHNDAFRPFGNDGLNFSDLVDIVNPLQHLPIIGDIYRDITGDKIEAAPKIAGGAIFFGPIGFVSSLANLIIQEISGNSIQGHISEAFNQSIKPVIPEKQPNEGPKNPVTSWAEKELMYRKTQAKQLPTKENPIFSSDTPEINTKASLAYNAQLAFQQKNNALLNDDYFLPKLNTFFSKLY